MITNLIESRVKQDLETIATFGALSTGGVTRLALTKEDLQARNYLLQQMEELNLSVTVDAVGNMFGRRKGLKDISPVLIGSHLDTVVEGGDFDGIAGVIAALEVMRRIHENAIQTIRPVELVNFTAEESSRFLTATLGSKCMKGSLTMDQLKSMKDSNSISFYEALHQAGFQPEQLDTVKKNQGDYHSFIELHIEQGPVLEVENKSIGIVTAIAAPTRLKVHVKGVADHSGTTPMHLRNDALVGASELVVALETLARTNAGPHTVATVGNVLVTPGVMNVIPGEVTLLVDIRDIYMEDKNQAVELFLKEMDQVAQKRNLQITYELLVNDSPVPLSDKIISYLKANTQKLNEPYQVMHSGAGHDAMNLVPITDVGMIFVPSRNGISHNKLEHTDLKHILKGIDLLYETVIQLAMEDEEDEYI